MLSRILIVIYILGVLLIAGFVKAEEPAQVQPVVTQASFQNKTWLMHIRGYIPQDCENAHVIPHLSISSKGKRRVTVDLEVKKNQATCIQAGETQFDLAFDLRSLFVNEKDRFQRGQPYLVDIKESQDTFFIASLELHPGFSFSTKQLVGTIKKMGSSNKYVLVQETSQGVEKEYVILQPGVIDLSSYINEKVVVTGRFQHHVTPFTGGGRSFVSQQHTKQNKHFAINGINCPTLL